MYFLRWLYREVNPMILILGLVMLYMLFNLATCSNSADSVVSDTTKTNTDSAQTTSVAKQEVVAKADAAETTTTVATVDKNTAAMTDSEGTPVESALSKVFKDKQVNNELNADLSTESVPSASKPSVLNRVFKKSADQAVAEAPKLEVVPGAEKVAEAVVDNSNKTAAVVTGAAVAAAGAVSAAVANDESEEVVETLVDEAVDGDSVETEVAVESEDKGGFFGLFNRSNETDADTEETEAVEQEVAVEEDVAVAEEAAPAEIATQDVVVEVEEVVAEEADTAEVAAVEVEEAAVVAEEVVTSEPAVVTESAVEVEQVEVKDGTDEVIVEVTEVETTEAQQPATDTVAAPPSYSANVSDNTAGLSAARRAFWDRDYATADTLYSEMITNEAGNAELIAEYGNMLLQSGQVEKTLDAYEQAANLMIDDGRKQEAKPLIDYISSWDQDRADALINKVFAQ